MMPAKITGVIDDIDSDDSDDADESDSDDDDDKDNLKGLPNFSSVMRNMIAQTMKTAQIAKTRTRMTKAMTHH